MTALALTYHSVEEQQGSLFVDPEAFARQLDSIVASGARAVRASELPMPFARRGCAVRPLRSRSTMGWRVLCGAAPLLAERGLPATVFCVAGHLGGLSDWPSDRFFGLPS